MKLVEAAGNAPALACLQGKCITFLPHPQCKMAGRSGAAPDKLSFGDSAARLVRDLWCGCRESHPDILPGEKTFCF